MATIGSVLGALPRRLLRSPDGFTAAGSAASPMAGRTLPGQGSGMSAHRDGLRDLRDAPPGRRDRRPAPSRHRRAGSDRRRGQRTVAARAAPRPLSQRASPRNSSSTAKTKGWDLGAVSVEVEYDHRSTPRHFEIDDHHRRGAHRRPARAPGGGRGRLSRPPGDRGRRRVHRANRRDGVDDGVGPDQAGRGAGRGLRAGAGARRCTISTSLPGYSTETCPSSQRTSRCRLGALPITFVIVPLRGCIADAVSRDPDTITRTWHCGRRLRHESSLPRACTAAAGVVRRPRKMQRECRASLRGLRIRGFADLRPLAAQESRPAARRAEGCAGRGSGHSTDRRLCDTGPGDERGSP